MQQTASGILINERAKSKTFTTAAGREIGIQPVPPLLIEEVRLRAQQTVEVPPKPTYQVELPDGSMMTYEHDEQSLTTDEEKAAWKTYQAALTRQSQVAATKVMELFMAKGTILEMSVGEWRELQEYFGVQVPENPIAAKIHFLRTELLTTTDDINNLMASIMEASGIDRTVLEAAQNSFRRNLRQEQNAISGASGEVQPAETGRQVVHEPTLPRDGDGESVASYALEMG